MKTVDRILSALPYPILGAFLRGSNYGPLHESLRSEYPHLPQTGQHDTNGTIGPDRHNAKPDLPVRIGQADAELSGTV